MGWAIRRDRVRYEQEDTGAPFGFVYVPLPDGEPYIDALEVADCFTDYQAEHEARGPWVCECGTHNESHDLSCKYCGLASCE